MDSNLAGMTWSYLPNLTGTQSSILLLLSSQYISFASYRGIGVAEYSNILKLVELCLTFAITNSKSETGFSHMRRIENDQRNNLGEESLSHLMRMVMDGKPYVDP